MDHIFLIMFGVTQAFIAHIREYRLYEASKMTPREFYLSRQDLAHCAVLSQENEADHVRHITEVFLMKVSVSPFFRVIREGKQNVTFSFFLPSLAAALHRVWK